MHYRRLQIFPALIALACWMFSIGAEASVPTLNVLYSFTNGLSPDYGVTIGANGNFYGVTTTGGPSNNGGVFQVTSNGVLASLVWFNGTDGATPLAPLVADTSGNFYGTASRGGISNNGTVFKVTSGGQIELLAEFRNTNGSSPQGPLLLGTNGYYYGTTFNGGANNSGVIFRVSTAGAISNLFSFGGSDGANPATGLIQGTNGHLYGTTEYGGANGLGTMFEMTYSNTLTTLASFSSQNGAFPGGLIKDSSNNFYGPAINGGANFAGTLFKFVANSNLETLVTFDLTNGANPNSPLIVGSNGNWYGTSEEGGAFGQGTVFLFNNRGFLTDLVSFSGTNGAWPRSGLTQGRDGNLYGTTSAGGANGFGEIYEISGFAPYIITPPSTESYVSNRSAIFVVTAGGSAPLGYQWIFDGTNTIADATNSSLTITNERLVNAGTYTVIVTNLYGTISNSAVLTVAAPVVTIISPPVTVTNASANVSGTASDPNSISIVMCQLNSNGWFAASGTTKWNVSVTWQPGTNILQAQSFDPVGNPSTIKSVTVFYSTVSPLTLQTFGSGTIDREFAGTNLIVGRRYTMLAIPGKDWLFLSWQGAVTATNNPLTFLMQSNLAEQAVFVPNPFIAATGIYEGLFFTSDAVAEQSAGLLSSLTIETTGAYSGQIVLKGLHYGFSGRFDAAEESSTTVARTSASGGPLALEMTLGGDEVTGTLSGTDRGGWTSPLFAERVNKAIGSAQYTLPIPPQAASNSPPGYGYALVTNHNGSVTLTGATADGAAFSQVVSTVGNGDVPFYASLYNNTGLLLGWLNVNGGLTVNNLWWVKPATNGFTNLVNNSVASPWTKPPPAYLSAGTLTISNASLLLNFTVSITNDILGKVTNGTNATNSLTGTFVPTTGLLRIIFGDGTGKETTTGYAAILGDLTNGGGYFLTKSNYGSVILAP